LNHRPSDHFHDYFKCFLDIEIGEVHDPPPALRQLPISEGLSLEILMGSSVDFHDQHGANGSEVDDE
jgi:hypothetical protein